jgi:hypothetical protein
LCNQVIFIICQSFLVSFTFFKMCNSIVDCFWSLCYIKCEERFHDDDIQDGIEYLTYEFTGSKDIYNGFVDRDIGCTDHIDYFSIYLMDDDRIVRKSVKTSLDVVTGTELSEGCRVILSSHVSVSTFLSLLHYWSFLCTSQFTPSAIFHAQPFFTVNNYTLLAILHPQSLYSVRHFIHLVILPRKPFYTLSHFFNQTFYTFSHFTL